MATYTEKNIAANIGATVGDLYAPTSDSSVVVAMRLVNKSGSPVAATVFLYDASVGASFEIAPNYTIPAYSSYPFTHKQFLEAGDKLTAVATSANAIVFTGSAVEKDN